MDLKEIEKQLQELQKVDFSTMTPEQLQKVVEQLLKYTSDAEAQLNNDIQTQIDELDEPEDS